MLKRERTYGGLYDRVDPFMITLGFQVVLSARRCVAMVITGKMKQAVVRFAIFSEPTLESPITLFPKYISEVIFCCDQYTEGHLISHDVNSLVQQKRMRRLAIV